MRVTHVLTYVSEDGAFGGPTAVAVAQLDDLLDMGVRTTLLAGWDGKARLRTASPQVLGRAWKLGRGFRAIIAPRLFWEMLRPRPSDEVLHVHLGRDPVSMAVAYIAFIRRRPFVVQTHGMIAPKSTVMARLFDSLFTRPVLRAAKAVFVLTDDEWHAIDVVAGGEASLSRLANGIRDSQLPFRIDRDPNLIIFLARLHPRKRVLAFVAMCRILRDSGVRFTAEVYGPDEGDLSEMLREIEATNLGSYIEYCGPVEPGTSTKVLQRAGLFVLPSFGEVFPMTILESLVSRTPIITTSDSGIATVLTELDAAVVTDGSPEQLAAAAASILLDCDRRESLVRNGDRALVDYFGIRAVTNQLVDKYRTIENGLG